MTFLLPAQAFVQHAPRFGQQFLGFGSSLDGPWFNAIGTDRENGLSNRSENNSVARGQSGVGAKAQIFLKGVEYLQCGLETQLSGQDIGETGGLGHDGAHQIVGEQVRRNFLLNHFRALAAENFHLHDRLDRTKVEFDLPALPVQANEFQLADLFSIEQRGHQDQIGDPDFSHDDRFGHGGVGGLIHPAWTLRASPDDDMVTLAQAPSATKVGLPALMLTNEHVDTALPQARNAEVACKVTVTVPRRLVSSASRYFSVDTPACLAASSMK